MSLVSFTLELVHPHPYLPMTLGFGRNQNTSRLSDCFLRGLLSPHPLLPLNWRLVVRSRLTFCGLTTQEAHSAHPAVGTSRLVAWLRWFLPHFAIEWCVLSAICKSPVGRQHHAGAIQVSCSPAICHPAAVPSTDPEDTFRTFS